MFGVASRLDVQIGVIASRALRLHGIVLIVRGQLLDTVVDILTDEESLLDPSCRAVRGSHLDEVAIMVKHFDAIAVLDDSGLLINRRDPIAQHGLYSGNVADLENASSATVTAC